jgi:hypothetical protein
VHFKTSLIIGFLLVAFRAYADGLQKLVENAWARTHEYQEVAQDIEALARNNKSILSTNQREDVGKNGIDLSGLLNQYQEKFHPGIDRPKLLIFISFSLKEQNIKEYAEQAKKFGGVLVLRGMYENSLLKTANKLHLYGIPAIIDPKSALYCSYQRKIL